MIFIVAAFALVAGLAVLLVFGRPRARRLRMVLSVLAVAIAAYLVFSVALFVMLGFSPGGPS